MQKRHELLKIKILTKTFIDSEDVMGGRCEISPYAADASDIVAVYQSQKSTINENCLLSFRCPIDKYVTVDVLQFDVGNSPNNCENDYLSFNGDKLCGKILPKVSTTDREMEIIFHSTDWQNSESLFELHLGCKYG